MYPLLKAPYNVLETQLLEVLVLKEDALVVPVEQELRVEEESVEEWQRATKT